MIVSHFLIISILFYPSRNPSPTLLYSYESKCIACRSPQCMLIFPCIHRTWTNMHTMLLCLVMFWYLLVRFWDFCRNESLRLHTDLGQYSIELCLNLLRLIHLDLRLALKLACSTWWLMLVLLFWGMHHQFSYTYLRIFPSLHFLEQSILSWTWCSLGCHS